MKWTRMTALSGALLVGALGATACDDDGGNGVDPVPPPAPTSVAASATNGSIGVTWGAVATATSYEVRLSTTGDVLTQTVQAGTTSATFTAVNAGQTYCPAVVAINSAGQSSAQGSCVTVPETDAPGAPTGVQATATTNSITVTFTRGDEADSHRVELRRDGAVVETEELQGTASSATFDGLPSGTAYQVRVIAANQNGETAAPDIAVSTESNIVEVTSDVLQNTTWTSDRVYRLNQAVFVGRDCGPTGARAGCTPVTLTIEPGTTILGKSDLPQGIRAALLVVTRGSRIVADANADRATKTARPNPEDMIVFTSDKPRGQRARGDWGGLVINGQAPTNVGDEAAGEGDSGFFGGPDATDDSGILRGVRVEFAGDDVTEGDQLNGIAMQGVGAGTIMDYIQVHYNVDDGTEPFGGTVSQTHMVLTGIGDDSFDGTDGYRGFIQFGIIQQRSDDADQGFELSNNGLDEDAAPRTMAVVANVTAIGANVQQGTGEIVLGGESDVGLLFREGSYWKVYNTIITGFDDGGICVENPQTIINANNRLAGSNDASTTLDYQGMILWSNGGTAGGGTASNLECDYADNVALFERAGANNIIADPNLPATAFSIGSQGNPPNFVPTSMPAGYTASNASDWMVGGIVPPVDGRQLQNTNYAGAVAPGTALQDAWYYGWTVFDRFGSDSRPGFGEGN